MCLLFHIFGYNSNGWPHHIPYMHAIIIVYVQLCITSSNKYPNFLYNFGGLCELIWDGRRPIYGLIECFSVSVLVFFVVVLNSFVNCFRSCVGTLVPFCSTLLRVRVCELSKYIFYAANLGFETILVAHQTWLISEQNVLEFLQVVNRISLNFYVIRFSF